MACTWRSHPNIKTSEGRLVSVQPVAVLLEIRGHIFKPFRFPIMLIPDQESPLTPKPQIPPKLPPARRCPANSPHCAVILSEAKNPIRCVFVTARGVRCFAVRLITAEGLRSAWRGDKPTSVIPPSLRRGHCRHRSSRPAELRRSAARVVADFLGGGADRFLRDRLEYAAAKSVAERVLDQAVLDAVKRQDAEPPAGLQAIRRREQEAVQVRDLVVDENAQRLERPRRRVQFGFARGDFSARCPSPRAPVPRAPASARSGVSAAPTRSARQSAPRPAHRKARAAPRQVPREAIVASRSAAVRRSRSSMRISSGPSRL